MSKWRGFHYMRFFVLAMMGMSCPKAIAVSG
jgi:hypothetical protein